MIKSIPWRTETRQDIAIPRLLTMLLVHNNNRVIILRIEFASRHIRLHKFKFIPTHRTFAVK